MRGNVKKAHQTPTLMNERRVATPASGSPNQAGL
jgi:hypothetical protein